jgi:hypothetical protein
MGGYTEWQSDGGADGGGGDGGVKTSTGTPGPVGKNDDAERKACEKGVSWELRDACQLPDAPGTNPSMNVPQRKVGAWLADHLNLIVNAEAYWQVDRRAIAAAIAWEAIENVQRPFRSWTGRSRGPGKVHVGTWYSQALGEFLTTIEQTEEAGYLKGVGITKDNLKARLATPEGAINCIAAVMRSDADVVTRIGGYPESQTYWNAPNLAAWYHGKQLYELVGIYSKKHYNGKPDDRLDPGAIPMGVWLKDQKHSDYLSAFVGSPNTKVKITPIPGAASPEELKKLAKAYDEKENAYLEGLSRAQMPY